MFNILILTFRLFHSRFIYSKGCDIMAKYKYTVSFEECVEKGETKRNDLIRINEFQGTALFSLFRNYKKNEIEMNDFVFILNNSGFKVSKATYNEFNNEYIIESPSGDIALYLLISKTEFFKNKDKKAYKATIDTLKGMYTDDVIEVGNNTKPLFNTDNSLPYSGEYKANLKEIAGGKKNVKVYMSTIRKLFKDKPKVAIALCTLSAAVTIVGAGFVVHAVNVRKAAQETINSAYKYSYQNDPSSDYLRNDRQLYEALQNGQYGAFEANPNGQAESNKIAHNAENYEDTQKNQNVR